MVAFNKLPEGKLRVGLNTVQEKEWLSAIKKYGRPITNRSLLSKSQKDILCEKALGTKKRKSGTCMKKYTTKRKVTRRK